MQWFSSDHVVTSTDVNATTEEGVFYVVCSGAIHSRGVGKLDSQSREGLQTADSYRS
jgi:hypothetical protein